MHAHLINSSKCVPAIKVNIYLLHQYLFIIDATENSSVNGKEFVYKHIFSFFVFRNFVGFSDFRVWIVLSVNSLGNDANYLFQKLAWNDILRAISHSVFELKENRAFTHTANGQSVFLYLFLLDRCQCENFWLCLSLFFISFWKLWTRAAELNWMEWIWNVFIFSETSYNAMAFDKYMYVPLWL